MWSNAGKPRQEPYCAGTGVANCYSISGTGAKIRAKQAAVQKIQNGIFALLSSYRCPNTGQKVPCNEIRVLEVKKGNYSLL